MIKNQIEAILTQEFNPSLLSVIDESYLHKGHEGARTGGGHYRLKIVSKMFSNKSLIERHRLIYQALDSLFKSNAIHALIIQADGPAL
jgi:BolA protein